MVGFIGEPIKEEDNGVSQPKLKASVNDSESYKFDFDSYSTDFDALSLASAQLSLDFDIFEDWIGEMQDTDQETAKKVGIGSGIEIDSSLENPNGNCLVDFRQDMKDLEKTVSVNVGCGGTDDSAVNNKNDTVRDDTVVKSCDIKDCDMNSFMKVELDIVPPAVICNDDHNKQQKASPRDESCIRVLDHGDGGKLDSLGCSIEEGLEKVSLVGNENDLVVCANGMKEIESASAGVGNNGDSDSESDSGSEATTSSSASSSSSESDDDEAATAEEDEKSCKNKNVEQKVDVEEGEITGSDSESMVSGSDNDGDDDDRDDEDSEFGEADVAIDDEYDEDISDLPKGPIKSKNEVMVLPPVPPVSVTLQPCHQILPVGAVSSILGAQVVVEGSEKHSPLSEGSILWISETRLPLGVVDEIFGPVKTPYYIVRYNSESDVPSGIQNGSLIGFVQEFVDHVLNDKSIYQKGYDASGENDEELMDGVEFSDDEKEAEYKLMMKMSKRGNSNQGPRNKKNKKNFKNRERTWTKDQPSASQAPTVPPSQPNQMQHHVRAPVPSMSQGNMPAPPLSRPNFPAGPTFAQQAQSAGYLLNGLLTNMMPFQQHQNVPFPGSFPMNGMPWLQQNPQAQQMPSITPLLQQQLFQQIPQSNPAAPQQQFDLSQLISSSSVSPLGPVNYAAGPTMAANSPWPGLLGPNLPNQAPFGLPSASNQFPMFPGTGSNEPQGGPSGNSQPAASFQVNADVRPQFNQGFSSGGGRGRKSFHPRGKGVRFEGRRGR